MKDSNYISLDKAINGGPKIEDLLKEIRFMKSNCSSPGLDKSNLLVRCVLVYELLKNEKREVHVQ